MLHPKCRSFVLSVRRPEHPLAPEHRIEGAELVDCVIQHEHSAGGYLKVDMEMAAEPLVILHALKHRVKEPRGIAGIALMAEAGYLPYDALGQGVCKDKVHPVADALKALEGVSGLLGACLLGAPPGIALGAVDPVDAGCSPEREKAPAPDLVDLAAHQVDDVFGVGVYLNSAAVKLGHGLPAPPVVVVVITVDEQHPARLLAEPVYPEGVLAVASAGGLVLGDIVGSEREAEIARDDERVALCDAYPGSFKLVTAELLHIQSAVCVARYPDHSGTSFPFCLASFVWQVSG